MAATAALVHHLSGLSMNVASMLNGAVVVVVAAAAAVQT